MNEQLQSVEWIFQFDRPHASGTVCGFPCQQCGEDRQMGISLHGKRIPNTPMMIVGPATQQEWLSNIEVHGGKPARARILRDAYYYRVSMD